MQSTFAVCMASPTLDNFRSVLRKQSSLPRSTSAAPQSVLDSVDGSYGVFSVEVRISYDHKYIEGQPAINIFCVRY